MKSVGGLVFACHMDSSLFVLHSSFFFQALVQIRLHLGIFRPDVDSHSEDAACIDEALSEDAEHAFVDLAEWRDDEASHGECQAADEHEHGGCDLNVEC